MFKPIACLLTGLLAAGTLFAKPAPNKSPASKDAAKSSTEQSSPAGSATADKKNPPPLDPKNMDTSVKPQDDFYLYANGTWIKNNPVPPEYSRWAAFNQLIEKNNDALHEIAEKAAASAPKDSKKNAEEADMQKVGDFYASGMNDKAVDTGRLKPLEGEFKRIDTMKNSKDVLKEIAHFHSMGIGAFFNFFSNQDDKDSTMVIGQANQGGLGMPDRDYYTKEDDASKKLRDQYIKHVTKMLTLAGAPAAQASEQAKKVMALETSLAKPARTRVELRDPQKNYNKMKQAELQALMPDFNWADYFKEIKLAAPGDINVGQPEFFKAAGEVFKSVSVDDWKTYLRWHLLHAMASTLSSDFVNENFRFFEATLRGTKQIKPRWKRVVAKTDEELGESLGKLYVAEHFPPEAKARALEMVNNLREALADRIKTLDWMDEPTKAGSVEETRRLHSQDRLSRQMARLLAAQDRSRPVRAQRRPRRYVRDGSAVEENRQTGRSQRMGHDAADGECLLQPEHERDRVPGGHSATALLRSQSR